MKLLPLSLIACSAFAVTNIASATEQAAGITFNPGGMGLSYSRVIAGDINSDDQIQLRGSTTSLNIDSLEEAEYSDIDYDMDIQSKALQLGVDWYPFSGRISKSFFMSGGLMYLDQDIKAESEHLQVFTVGSTLVEPSDDVTLNVDVVQESAAPYLSMGWGNRLHDQRRWYFQAELGLLAPFDDPEVSLSATDPQNVLSAADIAAEQSQLEDELGGLNLFTSLSVTYRF